MFHIHVTLVDTSIIKQCSYCGFGLGREA